MSCDGFPALGDPLFGAVQGLTGRVCTPGQGVPHASKSLSELGKLFQNDVCVAARLGAKILQFVQQGAQGGIDTLCRPINLVGGGLGVCVEVGAGSVSRVPKVAQRAIDRGQIVCRTSGGIAYLIGQTGHQSGENGQLVVQPLHGGLAIGEDRVGLQLAYNAAHVLAPPDTAVVLAARNAAVLQPGDAAHVVAGVRIAHLAIVETALDRAGIDSGNAAGMLCVRLVAVVDRPTVGAAVDQPVVAAGNTAGTGDSGDLGAADTGADHPVSVLTPTRPPTSS